MHPKDITKLLDIEEIRRNMGHDVETHLRYMEKENMG